jgi:lactate dehydrogenase-like 2-hydroxyacid dehydrogenase
MKPRAFLTFPLPDDALARIDAQCAVVRAQRGPPPSREELLRALADIDGLLATTRLAVDDELLAAAPRLRVVSNFGVGYDNVDVPAATRRGVLVCNTPDVLTDAVADLTMGMIIAIARRLVESERLVREGAWARGAAQLGTDLKGKLLGIIGLGRIGRAVAQRGGAFGMDVCFHDTFREPDAEHAFCIYRDLDDLLASADFVSLHVNLSGRTRGLIGARELALMKPTAFLINTSRGSVIDQPALADALREGRIAGAALDVLEREPPGADDAILAAPNALILPHIGSATRETRRAMLDLAIDNLLAAVRGETPRCVVNPEALNAARGAP